MNKRKPYWIKETAEPQDDLDLTVENRELLKQERLQHFLSQNSPIITEQWKQTDWIPNVTQRCGLIAIKLGMYPLWTKSGKKLDCTILQVPDNHAIRYIPPSEIDNYLSLRDPRGYWLNNQRIPSWVAQRRWGLQLVGAVSADPIEFSEAWCNLFKAAGVPPKRKISRFLVSPDAALKPGTPLGIHHFRVGDYVDITARTFSEQRTAGVYGKVFTLSVGRKKAHIPVDFNTAFILSSNESQILSFLCNESDPVPFSNEEIFQPLRSSKSSSVTGPGLPPALPSFGAALLTNAMTSQ
ncbi:unnamed protein product [Echinostoma caproni]|uniref:Large ribosomal subunit protein uL3m n=1 Tax=Echinostoma caproni TaxID=27848 RepID=A0A183BDT8_9TREM|nr:unnamed protein product [Echinostoma caproni]